MGYNDADWCRDKDDRNRKSTIDYVLMLEKAPISWPSKMHNIATLCSCEAEHVVVSMRIGQALWLTALMEESNLR